MASTLLERAYELAKSGDFRTMTGIKRQLNIERFAGVNVNIVGPSLTADLLRLCRESLAQ